MLRFDPAAAIEPGKSAAGILLDVSLEDLLAAAPGFRELAAEQLPFRLPDGMARYRYGDVDVWIEGGRVTQVMVGESCRGALLGKLTLGLPLARFEALLGRAELFDLSVRFGRTRGVSVDLAGDSLLPASERVVAAIYVFPARDD